MTNQATKIQHARRRAFRHPKQRFDKAAKFVWRKRLLWAGSYTEPGARIPEGISPGKIRRLWRSNLIEIEGWALKGKRGAEKVDLTQRLASLRLSGRGRFMLQLVEITRSAGDDGEIVYGLGKRISLQVAGLGNLLDHAAKIGIRERVETLVQIVKRMRAEDEEAGVEVTAWSAVETEVSQIGMHLDAETAEVRAGPDPELEPGSEGDPEGEEETTDPEGAADDAGSTEEGGEGSADALDTPADTEAGEGDATALDGGGEAAEDGGAPADSAAGDGVIIPDPALTDTPEETAEARAAFLAETAPAGVGSDTTLDDNPDGAEPGPEGVLPVALAPPPPAPPPLPGPAAKSALPPPPPPPPPAPAS